MTFSRSSICLLACIFLLGLRAAADTSEDYKSLEAALIGQMRGCWDDVADLPDPERLKISVRFVLEANGALKGVPVTVSPRPIPEDDKAMLVAESRAISAINVCAPFELPATEIED
ncbi:MAG: hypothetical protein AAFW65_06830 [Pseudomonadota bacterium]